MARKLRAFIFASLRGLRTASRGHDLLACGSHCGPGQREQGFAAIK